ncbi:hypothetical protein ACIQMJ_19115 [Actinosynnema sp. NPDC091369]
MERKVLTTPVGSTFPEQVTSEHWERARRQLARVVLPKVDVTNESVQRWRRAASRANAEFEVWVVRSLDHAAGTTLRTAEQVPPAGRVHGAGALPSAASTIRIAWVGSRPMRAMTAA